MDGLNRTGGQQDAAVVGAIARARMERIAEQAAKYKLPGMGAQPEHSDDPNAPPTPVPPMNLAQLRAWVEGQGGIDILA